MQPELFLSFSSHDLEVANLIVADVERHAGWRFFQCSRPEDNPAGGDWPAALAENLAASLAVVLLHSEHARNSRYVHREIEMAVAIDKPIVAIRLDDVPWAPGVDYLMRTIQAPLVHREDLVAYLPHLRNAIARVLPTALSLPLDAIADRQLKVEAICHLARLLAKEHGCVRLYGLALKLVGLDSLFMASPCQAGRTWDELCMTLRQIADFTCDENGGSALVPIISKEDIVLLIMVATDTEQDVTHPAYMGHLRRGLVAQLEKRGLNPICQSDELQIEDLSSAESSSMVADFLTGLAKLDVKSEANCPKIMAEQSLPTGRPEALRGALCSLIRSTKPLARALPLALTGVTAWQLLAQISRKGACRQ